MENLTGFLRLAVLHKQNRTIPYDSFYRGAFKITQPVYLDNSGQPCFYLMNPGGGYVDGDQYRAEICLDEDAHMLLTTQSSTKIYKTLKRPVVQETVITLKKGSFLEYIPDPIIAYQHARYRQQTVVKMERGASLVYAEIITPGWSPDGEWFRYDWLQLKTQVYLDEELVLFDHLKLCPGESAMKGLGMLEGYTHVGSMIVIGERATDSFFERLSDVLERSTFPVKIGLSMLTEPGFTLRVLSSSTQDIEKVFEACQQMIREQWFDRKPISLRKY
ncbi:urease accessory protein UreD [Brevibacillus ruminantium]|uniref:Urease accessory protein UreD n=1 Tax=Brevibacillus ruminantium TaxID=2950604 RepID=A0ABY4WFX9_9BACL|nr:urease accessory protein UreD [Brevibacillus ruminantium]USG65033.1 urease accessory protein UreD [Brevibacillus ruminantium]